MAEPVVQSPPWSCLFFRFASFRSVLFRFLSFRSVPFRFVSFHFDERETTKALTRKQRYRERDGTVKMFETIQKHPNTFKTSKNIQTRKTSDFCFR